LQDKADDAEIERRIREGVELVGATPWILMFAIFVASVGLNVNSTAVIIGAMLISPLMAPIMGAGLGVAVYDFALLKRSLLNLAIATAISLVVSALYFAISPLQEAQSELLARTTPTIWDVLIALFGGLAGIVGVTRQERSNVIPGVAIATALMPPVCTAGFGVATGQWSFVGGALYLYAINCVFIGLATVIGIRFLRLEPHSFANPKTAFKVKVGLLGLALCTALPSGYLAATLVKEEVFSARARKFVDQEFDLENTHLADSRIDPKIKKIEVSLIGAPLAKDDLNRIEGRLASAQLEGAKIIVHQSSDDKIDVTALKSSLLSDLYRDSQIASQKKDEEISKLNQEIASRKALLSNSEDISNELRAQYPAVSEILISEGVVYKVGEVTGKVLHLGVVSDRVLSLDEQKRIKDWFQIRVKQENVIFNFDTPKKSPQKL
jgi:uncharacterized hydrophobic protein (TIGR00271 family)